MKPEPNIERSIFNAALDQPPEHRDRFVAQECRGDDRLRKRVESLLRAHEEAGVLFEQPPAIGTIKDLMHAGASVTVTDKPGDRIGRYRLLEQIGEGGCGIVYVAEQEEPVRRRVALKVIKLGMDTRQVVARFEAERQALALMDHPNIARVLDAGATETGRPYFVMELVEGVRITAYCDRNALATTERLELFLQVCHAIQHAHQKGIIHRDIKPSNVLVTVHDGVPVPKVIDFGIAKATTGQRLTNKTVCTALEQFLGTPAYMSPEQAMPGDQDIDTRSDIYSLGVLLYELLTGRPPFDPKRLVASGLDAMLRTIREAEPPTPSACLSTMHADALIATAQHHRLEPSQLRHRVRGDLDRIVMKTLEKDRRRRYPTANELATDIQRHLKHEPVSAAAPSVLYRLMKSVRRHKAGFAVTAALLLLLIAGVVVSSWQAFRATHAERLARTEAAKKDEVARFLKEMLRGIEPSVARGRDTTLLREILERSVERVRSELREQPEVEAELLSTFGRVYWELGEYERAENLWRETLAVVKGLFPQGAPAVATALDDLAIAIYSRGRLAEAELLERQALAMRRRFLSENDPEFAISLNNLGLILRAAGEFREAEALGREDLTLSRKLRGDEHPDVASSLINLGLLLQDTGKTVEAESACREALRILKKAFGDEHPHLAIVLSNMALVLRDQGRLDEAEAAARDALAMQRRLSPDSAHPYTASFLDALGLILRDKGRLVEAEATHREALTMQTHLLGAEHPDVAESLRNLAVVLADGGQWAEMEALLRECLAIREKSIPDDWRTYETRCLLGAACLHQDRTAEAEPLLLAGLDGLTQRRDESGQQQRRVRLALES
ncbi:MAG: serine/threonine protein kinase [Verrucomicrobiales bacterium]|nr:serine/threonine protein kinase [Verrucomicrobiales bacterium]